MRSGAGTPAEAAARILAFGRAGLAARPEYANIASPIGVRQYVAIAEELRRRLPDGRVLDWGAGWGQNALLLAAHGLEVVAYDVEDKGAAEGLLAGAGVRYIVDAGPALPFAAGEFGAILNCGVLEHVADEQGALAELHRVLRPGGWLFTYHLPNRNACAEWLGRRLGRFHHERTYTEAEAVDLLARAGFRVLDCRPFHLLPRNVWARWAPRARLDGPAARTYDRLDRTLGRLPGLQRLATAWALVARRRD